MVLLALLIGLALGAAVAWFVLRERSASLARELERERAGADLETRMTAAAAEALRSNNETFLALAEGRLDQKEQAVQQLVGPIREKLDQVNGQLQGLEVTRATAYASLSEQVKILAAGQEQLRGETGNLVTALRAPATRGRWGEIQLRRVVEMAGM